MDIIEHGKNRQAIINDGYEYSETVYNEAGEAIEFFNACDYSDYSFMYGSLSEESKIGHFTIEIDSVFFPSFSCILEGIDELRIESDFSERFLEFKRCDNGEIEISFHLLPGEKDGIVDVKNIMYDLRSKADSDNTDIKKRLKKFFSVLSHTIQKDMSENKKELGLH